MLREQLSGEVRSSDTVGRNVAHSFNSHFHPPRPPFRSHRCLAVHFCLATFLGKSQGGLLCWRLAQDFPAGLGWSAAR